MMVWKMIFLFQGGILRFHVNLPGCKLSKILFGQLFTSTGCESLNKRDGVSVVTASFGGDPQKVPQCPETKPPDLLISCLLLLMEEILHHL